MIWLLTPLLGVVLYYTLILTHCAAHDSLPGSKRTNQVIGYWLSLANLFDFTNPKRAEWPEADFIVGNPPFIGTKRMIDALGEGYTETLRKVWKGSVPDSADFVMYWWRKAAELLAAKKINRFGFITGCLR